MRIFGRLAAAAFLLLSMPAALRAEEIERREPDIDMFASMTGKCSTLKVTERDFVCTTVAFSHSPGGRSGFTVPLNDPDDESHIITFSGEQAKREQDDRYELAIDRMLLKSKDRPKADGLPVPSIELATGLCRQAGNFVTLELSSISCTAVDQNGKKYELQYQSDGTPMAVRRIKRMRVGSPAVSPFDDVK